MKDREKSQQDYSLNNLVIEPPEEEIKKQPISDQPLIRKYFKEEMEQIKGRLLYVYSKKNLWCVNQEEFEMLRHQLKDLSEYVFRVAKDKVRGKTDSLTGFFSQDMASSRYELERDKLIESGEPDKVLVYLRLDLDYFKDINDRLGHNEGDNVLKALGQASRERLRPTDAAFRMGGDEFVFILSDVKKDDAIRIAKEIIKTIQERVKTSEGRNISFSVGLKIVEPGTKDFFRKIDEQADVAARLAKLNGRARIEAYGENTETELAAKANNPLYLRTELGQATSRLTGPLDPHAEKDREIDALLNKLANLIIEKQK